MAKAISTYKTYLMHKGSGSSYTKLLDIISFPNLGGEPETIDTTTLSDPMRTFILGIQSTEKMTFECNYNSEDYAKIVDLREKESDFAVWFGASTSENVDTPDGNEGKFSFKGYIDVYVAGGGVNEAVKMQVVIAPSSRIIKE